MNTYKVTSKLFQAVSFALFMLFFSFPGVGRADDCWISVFGSGIKNGKDAFNAYSASEGDESKYAQICWEQTGPDGTMHVMEGEYTVENKAFWRLRIMSANDGSKAPKNKFKRLLGEGSVLIRGPRKIPYDFSMKAEGGAWLDIARGAGRFRVQNFKVSRVAEGIAAQYGGNVALQFHDLHFEDTRQNIIIHGQSREILIQDTSGVRYSKRHIRLGWGISRVRVVNSHANAEFLDGDFAVGFDVENQSSDIEFNLCSSRGNVYTLSPYWNGDGFKAENETRNIRWLNCSAFDNGDAGFDIKTENAYLQNIIALRNNRNIRIWSSKKAVVKNANASYAKHRGGIGIEAGIWSVGALDCQLCTLHNNKIQVLIESAGKGPRAQIRFFDSILSADDQMRGEGIRQEKGTRVDLIRTVQWNEGGKGLDPKFGLGATAQWEGGNREFNSLLYGKIKGYHYE